MSAAWHATSKAGNRTLGQNVSLHPRCRDALVPSLRVLEQKETEEGVRVWKGDSGAIATEVYALCKEFS